MFVGLFTGLFQTGGIEQINRHTGGVLEEIAHERGQPCQLLSLNDIPGLHSFVVDGHECEVRGFGRRKSKFIAHVLSVAHQVDAAYLGHPNLAPLGLLLRIANPRLRYWVASYGVEVWYPLPPLHRLALYTAHGVTAISRFTAEQMIKTQRLDPHKVVVLPPALDPGFTHFDAKGAALSLPSESSLILTVGRLVASEPGKGIDTVIRALPKVLRAVPNTLYVVVGDGDYRPYLRRLTDEIGVRDRVLFVGETKRNDLKTYYWKADVFAMPSRQEGFGIVFLEAMAFGKPTIGGNHGGTPEVVVDGVTGFLVEYGDVDTLADRLIHLLRDKGLRKQMGEAGRSWVQENYTFEHFSQRLLRLLRGDNQCVF